MGHIAAIWTLPRSGSNIKQNPARVAFTVDLSLWMFNNTICGDVPYLQMKEQSGGRYGTSIEQSSNCPPVLRTSLYRGAECY
jgi:hypothetical protein